MIDRYCINVPMRVSYISGPARFGNFFLSITKLIDGSIEHSMVARLGLIIAQCYPRIDLINRYGDPSSASFLAVDHSGRAFKLINHPCTCLIIRGGRNGT